MTKYSDDNDAPATTAYVSPCIHQMTVLTPFTTSYSRTNRSTGQKSLRCFPHCSSSKGHQPSGFCGCCLEVLISMNRFDHWKDMIVIADLHPFSTTSVVMGQMFERAQVLDQIQTGFVQTSEESRNYWLGDLELKYATDNSMGVHAYFNKKLKSWDYMWNSSRWTADLKHTITVYVLLPVDNEQHYQVVGITTSPEFSIVSKRSLSMHAKEDEMDKQATTTTTTSTTNTTNSMDHSDSISQNFATSHKRKNSFPYAYTNINNGESISNNNNNNSNNNSDSDIFHAVDTLQNLRCSRARSNDVPSAMYENNNNNNLFPVSQGLEQQPQQPQPKQQQQQQQIKMQQPMLTLSDIRETLASLSGQQSGRLYAMSSLLNASCYLYDVEKALMVTTTTTATPPTTNTANQHYHQQHYNENMNNNNNNNNSVGNVSFQLTMKAPTRAQQHQQHQVYSPMSLRFEQQQQHDELQQQQQQQQQQLTTAATTASFSETFFLAAADNVC